MSQISQWLAFLLPLVCSMYFFPRWADVNANSRLDTVLAIVHDGTARIDRYVHNTVDYAMVDGHYYSDKAPGLALLGVPVYAVAAVALDLPATRALTERLAAHDSFRSTLRADGSGVSNEKVRFALALIWLSFALAAVPTALICLSMHVHLRGSGFGYGVALLAPLIYALATPAFAYANAFYGHQLAAALLFTAFVLLARREKSAHVSIGRAEGACVGLLLGGAVITEYPAVIPAAILFAYAAVLCVRRRAYVSMAAVIVGGMAMAGVLAAYNTIVFGGPFELGYARSTLWQSQHSSGLFSIGYPQPDVLLELLFGVFRGLFVLSPVLLLVIPGIVVWRCSGESAMQWWVAVLCSCGMLIFNASSAMWWGGWGVGPRYLLPALPFAALALPYALRATTAAPVMMLAVASLLATWAMTVAGQTFPSDALRNPWLDHVLPAWTAGDVARSWGTLVGLRGAAALVPPVAAIGLSLGGWRVLTRRSRI